MEGFPNVYHSVHHLFVLQVTHNVQSKISQCGHKEFNGYLISPNAAFGTFD